MAGMMRVAKDGLGCCREREREREEKLQVCHMKMPKQSSFTAVYCITTTFSTVRTKQSNTGASVMLLCQRLIYTVFRKKESLRFYNFISRAPILTTFRKLMPEEMRTSNKAVYKISPLTRRCVYLTACDTSLFILTTRVTGG